MQPANAQASSPAPGSTGWRCTHCGAHFVDHVPRCPCCEIDFVGAFSFYIVSEAEPEFARGVTGDHS